MEAKKKMDIHITMGKADGHQFLTEMNATITTDPNLLQHMVQQSQFKQDIGDDFVVVFHFHVEQGKEKQALAYFQQALKEERDEQKMSPIQKPLKKPISKGFVDLVQTQGCIIVKYRFLSVEIMSEEETSSFHEQFGKFEMATLNTSVSLKGQIRHSNNNRTNLKVNYVDLRIYSGQINPSNLSKIMKHLIIQEEDQQFMSQIPAVQMMGNLKSANFQIKLASFRQLRGYYNKACGQKFNKQEKPFPYINKGLFRKQVSCFGIFKNKVGLKADATYNGEDVLMRLVKGLELDIRSSDNDDNDRIDCLF